MTQQKWGTVTGTISALLANFRDLPGVNVVFLAQDRMTNLAGDNDDEDALIPEIGPAASPSIVKAITADASFVGYTYIRERQERIKQGARIKRQRVTEYCLRTGPSSVFITKTRKPKGVIVPDTIVDPTYDSIVTAMRGENYGTQTNTPSKPKARSIKKPR